MITTLRNEMGKRLSELHVVADAIGIDAEDLRRFTFGKLNLDGFALDDLARFLGYELQRAEVCNRLPLEDKFADGIKTVFADDFKFAGDLIDLSLLMIGTTKDGTGTMMPTKHRGITPAVLRLSLSIYAKSIKQYRSITALCEHGLAEDAGIVERSLFETMLALQFVLRSNKPPLQGGKVFHDKPYGAKSEKTCTECHHVSQAATPGKRLRKLTGHMRAKLYIAHFLLEQERQYDAFVRDGMIDEANAMGNVVEIRRLARLARKSIGEGWADRISDIKHFSGINVHDLARTFKQTPYLIGLYRRQSHSAHGMDALLYTDPSGDESNMALSLAPSADNVKATLRISASLMMTVLGVMNWRYGFGVDDKIKRMFRYHTKLCKVEDPTLSWT